MIKKEESGRRDDSDKDSQHYAEYPKKSATLGFNLAELLA